MSFLKQMRLAAKLCLSSYFHHYLCFRKRPYSCLPVNITTSEASAMGPSSLFCILPDLRPSLDVWRLYSPLATWPREAKQTELPRPQGFRLLAGSQQRCPLLCIYFSPWKSPPSLEPASPFMSMTSVYPCSFKCSWKCFFSLVGFSQPHLGSIL